MCSSRLLRSSAAPASEIRGEQDPCAAAAGTSIASEEHVVHYAQLVQSDVIQGPCHCRWVVARPGRLRADTGPAAGGAGRRRVAAQGA